MTSRIRVRRDGPALPIGVVATALHSKICRFGHHRVCRMAAQLERPLSNILSELESPNSAPRRRGRTLVRLIASAGARGRGPASRPVAVRGPCPQCRSAAETALFSSDRVTELESPGQQLQRSGEVVERAFGEDRIEVITQDRHTETTHVHPELVSTPGGGCQLVPTEAVAVF